MTPSLFDTRDTWHTDPALAFASFLQSPEFQLLSRRHLRRQDDEVAAPPAPIRSSSAIVYRAMWAKFLRWLAERQRDLFDVTSADLLAFLDYRNEEGHAERSSLIKLRYLRVFERVYTHLQVPINPARNAMFDALQAGHRSPVGRDDDKVSLTDAQQAAFMLALPAPDNWKRRRDRAMQAMMLGAGLKVSEVIGLRMGQVDEPDGIEIPITITAARGGTAREHRAMLRAFAVDEVARWLRERRALGIAGALLFPATVQGGLLNAATVYRNVKKTFAAAAIAVPRKGGRTLRNAYAIRELKTESLEHVGELLGHRKRRSTEYYLVKPVQPSLIESAAAAVIPPAKKDAL